MSKAQKIAELCCALFNTATGLFESKWMQNVLGDKSVEYIDLLNLDAQDEVVELTLADVTPWADQIVVDCDHDIKVENLCERFKDANWKIEYTVEFERCQYLMKDKLGNKITPIPTFDRFVRAIDGSVPYPWSQVEWDLYVFVDGANVANCDISDKQIVNPFTVEAFSDAVDTVTIPAWSTQLCIRWEYQDADEGSAWYTINGQVVTDSCACKDKKYEAWDNQCFWDVVITTAPEDVPARWESKVCVDYIA